MTPTRHNVIINDADIALVIQLQVRHTELGATGLLRLRAAIATAIELLAEAATPRQGDTDDH